MSKWVLILLSLLNSSIWALFTRFLSSIMSGLFSKPLMPALLTNISILSYNLLISLNFKLTSFGFDTSNLKAFPLIKFAI